MILIHKIIIIFDESFSKTTEQVIFQEIRATSRRFINYDEQYLIEKDS